jgi:hypothetical protein
LQTVLNRLCAVVEAIGEQLVDSLLASGVAFILRLSGASISTGADVGHQCHIQ